MQKYYFHLDQIKRNDNFLVYFIISLHMHQKMKTQGKRTQQNYRQVMLPTPNATTHQDDK